MRSAAAALAGLLFALPSHAESAVDFFRADAERRGLHAGAEAAPRASRAVHRSAVAQAVHARAPGRAGHVQRCLRHDRSPSRVTELVLSSTTALTRAARGGRGLVAGDLLDALRPWVNPADADQAR
jgi:hypothetical protein